MTLKEYKAAVVWLIPKIIYKWFQLKLGAFNWKNWFWFKFKYPEDMAGQTVTLSGTDAVNQKYRQ